MKPQTTQEDWQRVVAAAAERRRLQEEHYRNGAEETSPRGLSLLLVLALSVYGSFTTWLLWQQ
jgi:hypothetical protein